LLQLAERHFNYFKNMPHDLHWPSISASKWGNGFLREDGLPRIALNRHQLTKFCSEPGNTDEACYIACMAWGGMRRNHGKTSWEMREVWKPIVAHLRTGATTRIEAYRDFNSAKIVGLGPAYFTKLIFFLRPELKGYILDQWTAKSISILFKQRFIDIQGDNRKKRHHVTRSNDAQIYDRYCSAVETLANELKKIAGKEDASGDMVERMLFSLGGKSSKGAWRSYVIQHWSQDR
jgi:hypothetical protein